MYFQKCYKVVTLCYTQLHATFNSNQGNMLCLDVWSGRHLSRASHAESAPCYAKLGGKCVGKIRLCTSTSANHVLRDIQRQASKLVPHAWRGFEDTIVWCDDRCLIPSGFAYKNDLTQEEAEQVWSVLGKAQRFDVMWDDNDEYAKVVLTQKQIQVYFFAENPKRQRVYVYFRHAWQEKPSVLPLELLFANKRFDERNKPVWFTISASYGRMQLVDMQAIKRLGVNKLRLIQIEPTSWHACRNIKTLIYVGLQSRVPAGVATLRSLESLLLEDIAALPDDFGCLALKTLVLARCDLDLALLVQNLANMPTLKHLELKDHYRAGSTIPTDLGLVASLEILSFTRNNFVGSIPSELGKLTNLVTIDIIESDTCALDMTFPKEVLDLNISLSAKRYNFVI